jgi:hypothetical protein
MIRLTTTLGVLLDAALDFALEVHPTPITIDPERFGLGDGERVTVEPRSIARALLANHLRTAIAADPDAPDPAYPYPSFEDLAALGGRPLSSDAVDQDADADDLPDVAIVDGRRRLLCAFTVGYGWEPDVCRDRLDAGLRLMWSDMSTAPFGGVQAVAHVFVHETGFGEIIRDTDRMIDHWIGANYGPFNGMDRHGLPMMPRLLRSSKHCPLDGTMLSKIDGVSRPTGFAAYAIVYERDAP